jgi:hypothetical protein
MPFGHAQTTVTANTFTIGATSLSVSLASAPQQNDLVCVACFYVAAQTKVTSCSDGNGNFYIRSVSSPSSAQDATSGSATLFYWIANRNGHQTITFQFTSLPSGNSGVVIVVDDFTVTGGIAQIDKDAAGSSGVAGVTINTPSFAPTYNTGELFYAYGVPQHVCTAVNAPWTGIIEVGVNTCAEYILNVTSSQNPNVTQTSGVWDSMMMAFFIAPANYAIDDYGQTFSPGR